MNRDAWKRYAKSGSWYYESHDTGFKYNLSDVHAAIGLAQLHRADGFMRARTEIARAYNAAFKGEDALLSSVQMPGGIPVATVAIGKAGARNAGYLAAQIMAVSDAGLAQKLRDERKANAEKILRRNAEVQKELGLD